MNKTNQMLNEKTKAAILNSLMKSSMSFSDLLKGTGIMDHGLLNYHIKAMIKEGLIRKADPFYEKTSLGERMGVYISQFQAEEMYPISVVCAIVANERDEILLLKRARSPQKGKWGFPGGKVRIGETISKTAEREVLEETGMKVKMEKVAGFFPSIVYKDKELNFHANIIPVYTKKIKSSSKIIINKDEHEEYAFVKKNKIKDYDLVVNNHNILNSISRDEFNFNEFFHHG